MNIGQQLEQPTLPLSKEGHVGMTQDELQGQVKILQKIPLLYKENVSYQG